MRIWGRGDLASIVSQAPERTMRTFRRTSMRIKVFRVLTLTVISSTALLSGTVNADWVNRTVTSVDGVFTSIQPAFGFETGLGTPRLDWGVPIDGSVTSFLRFQGYDAVPGVDQSWSAGGQTVRPGDKYLAGTILY